MRVHLLGLIRINFRKDIRLGSKTDISEAFQLRVALG